MSTLLVELKAKVNKSEEMRRSVSQLGAQYIGSFHQVDTYFEIREGRLKIRETEEQDSADIIFYERPNTPDIKESRILLVKAQPPQAAKKLLSKLFATKTVVDKIREIFILGNTRIHLDQVAQLGAFIEFELLTTNEEKEIESNKMLLANLCRKLGIEKECLEALSYADLVVKKGQ